MKIRYLLTWAIFISCLSFIFSSCQFVSEEPKQFDGPTVESNREFLAILKARNNHTVSLEVLQDMISSLLNQDEQLGRSVASTEKTVITGSEKLSIIGEKRFAAKAQGRSVTDTNQEVVEVYSFITEKPGNANPGYVLASNDIRIGNLLAVVEEGFLDNEESAEFMDIVYEGIANYIDRVIDDYNSITEEEIEQAVGRSARYMAIGQTGSGQTSVNTTNGIYKSLFSNIPSGAIVVAARWSWYDGFYTYNNVAWNQSTPYNYVVNNKFNNGNSYYTGCGPTAVAQLMAYYRYPAKSTLNLTIPSLGLNMYNRIYNWGNMTYSSSVYTTSDPGALDIAVLMLEVGTRMSASYGTSSTSTATASAITALRAMGYTTPNSFSSYNYTTIKNSILNSRPVLIRGDTGSSGHMWLIDGVRRMEYEEDVRLSDGSIRTYSTSLSREDPYRDWVHCNLGWGGTCNAWYISGIFDARYGYQSHARVVDDNSSPTISYYFQYDIKILPDARP